MPRLIIAAIAVATALLLFAVSPDPALAGPCRDQCFAGCEVPSNCLKRCLRLCKE